MYSEQPDAEVVDRVLLLLLRDPSTFCLLNNIKTERTRWKWNSIVNIFLPSFHLRGIWRSFHFYFRIYNSGDGASLFGDKYRREKIDKNSLSAFFPRANAARRQFACRYLLPLSALPRLRWRYCIPNEPYPDDVKRKINQIFHFNLLAIEVD